MRFIIIKTQERPTIGFELEINGFVVAPHIQIEHPYQAGYKLIDITYVPQKKARSIGITLFNITAKIMFVFLKDFK